MVSKTEFKDFMRQIVSEEFCDEQIAFDVGAEDLVDALYKGEDITKPRKVSSVEYEFLPESIELLKFVGTLFSTYVLFKKASEAKKAAQRKDAVEELSKEWMVELKKYGLSAKQAETVANKYSKRAFALMNS